MAPINASSSTLATYLTKGYWYDIGGQPYRFDTRNSNVISVDLDGLTTSAKAMARAALDAWASVANISFREVASGADINFKDDNNGGGPETRALAASSGYADSATVHIPQDWISKYSQTPGGYGFHVYIHEIGHALGLGHTGTYPTGTSYSQAKYTTDSWQQSVMSYLDQDENPNVAATKGYLLTPMMADMLAIQQLYGRATGGPTSGATVYGVGSDLGTYLDSAFRGTTGSLARNSLTIYDAGGTDLIDFSNDTLRQEVNLGGGTFSTVYGRKDGLGIAFGTVIENYRAGSGNDLINGNAASNSIVLGNGDDIAIGKQGSDRLSGGAGTDRLLGGIGNDALRGGGGHDRLEGEAGDDKLFGNSGRDRLIGGSGNDWLTGGAGADSFVIQSGRDTVLDFLDDIDTLVIDDALWGNRSLSINQVLNLADVRNGDIVFDFAGDHALVIDNRTNIAALANDITII